MHRVVVWKTMLNRQSCFSVTLRLSVLYIFVLIVGKSLEHNGYISGV